MSEPIFRHSFRINMNKVLSVSGWGFWGRGVACVIAQVWGPTAVACCVAGEATRQGCEMWRRSVTVGLCGAVTSSATRVATRRRNTSVTRQGRMSVLSGHSDRKQDRISVKLVWDRAWPAERILRDSRKKERMFIQMLLLVRTCTAVGLFKESGSKRQCPYSPVAECLKIKTLPQGICRVVTVYGY